MGDVHIPRILELAVSSVTVLTVAQLGSQVACTATSAAYAVTLPAAASCTGLSYTLRMLPTNTKLVTLTANAAELIDGSNTRIMWAGEAATIFCDGTGWHKTAGKTIPMTCLMSQVASVGQSIATGAFRLVTLDTSNTDNTGLMASTGSHYINVVRGGNYLVSITLSISGSIATSSYNGAYGTSGSATAGILYYVTPGTGGVTIGNTVNYSIATNGTVGLWYNASAASAITSATPYLSVTEIPIW